MFNIVIFGPPGSGKGTQSEKIINKYNLKHISTGDLLRKEKNSGSDLGNKIAELINAGNLVPDEMVEEMVENFVMKNKDAQGFIFDGFPRTVKQAEWLEKMLKKVSADINLLISLDVNDEELRTRILERGKVSGRADDQDVSIINNRIKVYKELTLPVMDFYEAKGKLALIDGIGSVDDIFERISNVIEKAK